MPLSSSSVFSFRRRRSNSWPNLACSHLKEEVLRPRTTPKASSTAPARSGLRPKWPWALAGPRRRLNSWSRNLRPTGFQGRPPFTTRSPGHSGPRLADSHGAQHAHVKRPCAPHVPASSSGPKRRGRSRRASPGRTSSSRASPKAGPWRCQPAFRSQNEAKRHKVSPETQANVGGESGYMSRSFMRSLRCCKADRLQS